MLSVGGARTSLWSSSPPAGSNDTMEAPRKKAKTRPDDSTKGGAQTTTTAEQQIAKLQAELERCKREKIEAEARHKQVVRNLSDALEWAYSVGTAPIDHWIEKGHTEEYADAMEVLLDRFKFIVKELRTGTVGGRVSVSFYLEDEDGREIAADHDDALMPYWKEFANALVHWSEYHANGTTLNLSIRRIETPDAVLDVLHPAIKQSRVEYVGFVSDGSTKTWKLPEFIEDIIHTNHQVTEVGFNSIGLSKKAWMMMCNAIRMRNAQRTHIMSVVLQQCFVGGIRLTCSMIFSRPSLLLELKGRSFCLKEMGCPRVKRQS